MALPVAQRHPIMCITQDGLPFSHVEQAERLCAAGAKWIQLRLKRADEATWLATASTVVEICRAGGSICVINDRIEIAVATGADGVHLGRTDGDWAEARRRLGSRLILGGTVNNAHDARAANTAGCLDYVGIGPWRYTTNKRNLAPVLGADGVRALVGQLDGFPVWAIGGIEPDDLPAVRATGAVGAAVSSSLFHGGAIEENYRELAAAWQPTATLSAPLESQGSTGKP